MFSWLTNAFNKLGGNEGLSFTRKKAFERSDCSIELSTSKKKYKVNRQAVLQDAPILMESFGKSKDIVVEIGKEKEEYLKYILDYYQNNSFNCPSDDIHGVLMIIVEYSGFETIKKKIAKFLIKQMKPFDAIKYFFVIYNRAISQNADTYDRQIVNRSVFSIKRFFNEIDSNEESRKLLIDKLSPEQILYIFDNTEVNGVIVSTVAMLRFITDWTLHDLSNRLEAMSKMVEIEKKMKYGLVKCNSLDCFKEYGIKEFDSTTEFLFRDDEFTVSKINSQKVKIDGNTSQYAYIKCYNKTELSTGKYKWQIKVQKFSFWLGVGVALKDRVENEIFDDFVSPYDSHGCYMMSANSYKWEPTKYTSSSFPFAVNDEIIMELDCDKRVLSFTNVTKGTSTSITNIDLPVFPSIVMGGSESLDFEWLSV
ncbi:predicted protein [Naegleria gruberi]|uniref:Predicted protein n=1 Tax=Naegleria gruberi TaxID=5762 RepID=D2V584_NAEGR|nr:uncharacterized protein NAEGRDRAFT_64049 [Naegleria gruberi]EFC48230.1 predicted protein [Naegleria gruberi]|eukprot:XP_002680974.1 predicted protein [Naegleria gruberi strain NEG-M]